MDVLTPVVTGAMVAIFTLVITWFGKGRFDGLERRMDAHEQSNERRFEQLVTEMIAIRSDLTQIALALGTRTRPETGS